VNLQVVEEHPRRHDRNEVEAIGQDTQQTGL